MTRRDEPGICVARKQCRTRRPVEDDHFMAVALQLVGGGNANDARAENDDLQRRLHRIAYLAAIRPISTVN